MFAIRQTSLSRYHLDALETESQRPQEKTTAAETTEVWTEAGEAGCTDCYTLALCPPLCVVVVVKVL